jgi:beta-xylosidase
MIKKRITRSVLYSTFCFICISCQNQEITSTELMTGNPIIEDRYADPEATILDNQYWIYATFSGDKSYNDSSVNFSKEQVFMREKAINKQYLKQTFIDAFSSLDLKKWNKHSHVLDIENVSWASYAIWAPSIIYKNGNYYLFFSANDIQKETDKGGIGVAKSKSPKGPFVDLIGKPLINSIANGAQPIDQFIFKDDDNIYYLYYGGWGHCNVVQLDSTFMKINAFDDGSLYKEITPEDYVEGPYVFKRKGIYYLMWSEGSWSGADYSVSYGMSNSPLGPFKKIAKVLRQDSLVATGAGHHSLLPIPDKDAWYIVYHRRPLNADSGNHRQICIDTLVFDSKGFIKPVVITKSGVRSTKIN